MSDEQYKVRTPLFPKYSTVRELLRILEGEKKPGVRQMINDILDQTGTPQNPLEWTNPSEWVSERLSGKSSELAGKIWQESEEEVNPRYTRGPYLFINKYSLLKTDGSGVYRLSERGRRFINNDQDLIREIDDQEGLAELLQILSTKTEAMRKDILPEWEDFLQEYSKYQAESTVKSTLRKRLTNLIDRGYVEKDGNLYKITKNGEDYSSSFEIDDPWRQLDRTITSYNRSQKATLLNRMAELDPFKFEYLIKDLLDAMGYDDVTVTKQRGDKGVDVVADIQSGITNVREVVQVKRQTGSISRPKLDQLRGALPYHDAIRGTIITLGKFSTGCKEAALFKGAVPITLIDGERLLDLLVEHGIGIKNKPVSVQELDESYFKEMEEFTPD